MPERSLAPAERQAVLDALHSERFADKAPAEVWATLLDKDSYLCSVRTMDRILDDADEVRKRRDQLRHPTYKKPELIAEAPNQVWSWDITKLLGPTTWSFFHLYVIIDIFSRYVVGWMVADREPATLASQLIDETCAKQGIQCGLAREVLARPQVNWRRSPWFERTSDVETEARRLRRGRASSPGLPSAVAE